MTKFEDRIAIRELIDRYTISVTQRDWDAVASCFHTNGAWRTSVGHDVKGRDQVRETIRDAVVGQSFLVQMTHGLVIDELTDTSARAKSVLNEFGAVVNVLGIYHDTLVKEDGQWFFEERYFNAHYIDPAENTGNVMIDYANQP